MAIHLTKIRIEPGPTQKPWACYPAVLGFGLLCVAGCTEGALDASYFDGLGNGGSSPDAAMEAGVGSSEDGGRPDAETTDPDPRDPDATTTLPDGGVETDAAAPDAEAPDADAATPPTESCGNKQVAATETCDDGNTTGADGCSASCDVEDGWLCPPEGGACIEQDATCDATMSSGDQLLPGEHLCSPSGIYRFGLADDGNLTFWRYQQTAWTAGTAGASRVALQGDGNLVVRQGDTALWSTKTHGNDGAMVRVQNAGSVVISLDDAVLWQVDEDTAP